MALSFLIEDIEKGTGKFDLNKTYFINNPTNEDVIVTWGAKEPEARGSGTYRIKSGEKGGPYPQFLAYHIVKALVSREMQKDGKAKFFGSATHRAEYEKKFLIEIEGGEGDSFTASIREQERTKLLEEMKSQPISEGQVTSSETRRKALGKKSHTDEEYAGANK
jgi:hypothetical protein